LGTACDNKLIDNAADFRFETIDNEKNTITLVGTIRYRLQNRLEKKLTRKYGRQYKDSLFIPTITSISKEILKDYSAGEIYNYKRDEIVQRLYQQTKTSFSDYDIEVTNLAIWSVELPDTLMDKVVKKHLERFGKDSVNNRH
jgi:regulator of protease activity HflC (stomatin/prohibitin superfamily)